MPEGKVWKIESLNNLGSGFWYQINGAEITTGNYNYPTHFPIWLKAQDNISFYNVAIFMALVISVPMRAMHQITYPITAKLMSEKKWEELNELYKKSSVSLQVIGGLLYIGILVNLNQVYSLLPDEGYRQGVFVVFTIGLSKYFDLILGINNAIIFNSKYYRAVLLLGVLLVIVIVLLNMYFIPEFGLNGEIGRAHV